MSDGLRYARTPSDSCCLATLGVDLRELSVPQVSFLDGNGGLGDLQPAAKKLIDLSDMLLDADKKMPALLGTLQAHSTQSVAIATSAMSTVELVPVSARC